MGSGIFRDLRTSFFYQFLKSPRLQGGDAFIQFLMAQLQQDFFLNLLIRPELLKFKSQSPNLMIECREFLVDPLQALVDRIDALIHRVKSMVHRVKSMVHRVKALVHRVKALVHRVKALRKLLIHFL